MKYKDSNLAKVNLIFHGKMINTYFNIKIHLQCLRPNK